MRNPDPEVTALVVGVVLGFFLGVIVGAALVGG